MRRPYMQGRVECKNVRTTISGIYAIIEIWQLGYQNVNTSELIITFYKHVTKLAITLIYIYINTNH